MRIVNNYSYTAPKSNATVKNNSIIMSNPSCRDSLSFGANLNKPSKGIIAKITDVISAPFKSIIERNKEKARLKQEAEEAARKAAILAEKEALIEKRKEIRLAADEYLDAWRAKYKGVFDSRRIIDDTGDVEISANDLEISKKIDPQYPKMKYTLLNMAASGYGSKPIGAKNWLLKNNNHGLYVNSLKPYELIDDEYRFKKQRWSVHYASTIRISRDYEGVGSPDITVLTCGWMDNGGLAFARYPGINIAIEGKIPYKDICEIKKNIVEKGLWDNFKENQNDDAITGIFNEIINYLNK